MRTEQNAAALKTLLDTTNYWLNSGAGPDSECQLSDAVIVPDDFCYLTTVERVEAGLDIVFAFGSFQLALPELRDAVHFMVTLSAISTEPMNNTPRRTVIVTTKWSVMCSAASLDYDEDDFASTVYVQFGETVLHGAMRLFARNIARAVQKAVWQADLLGQFGPVVLLYQGD